VRYAVLSDIHANLEALQAVLADAAPRTDAVLCLGDLVGYGADPSRASRPSPSARRRSSPATTSTRSPGSSISTGSTSTPAPPPSGRRSGSTWTIGAIWGRCRWSPRSVTPRSSTPRPTVPTSGNICSRARTASRSFGAFKTRLCFFGHSHLAGAWSLGSSGPEHRARRRRARARARPALPRERRQRRSAARSRSACLLRDLGPRPRSRRDTPRRLRREAARAKILRGGLPRFLADRLAWGS
jgi:hypothetical protein